YILKAFENGADGVMVVGCQEGNCKDISGNVRARKRVEYARRLLEEVGLERERLKMYHLAANRGVEWAEVVTEMFTTVKLLGPSAVRKQGEGVRT
ncbi:MAG: hydrogenase iron-sulfur subunit, partial [Clostridia bacterium]|nr:hydrogenase iron-sulfur subunit [Clostridia bacterium]